MNRTETIAVVLSIVFVLGLIAFFPIHHIKSIPEAPFIITVTAKPAVQPLPTSGTKPTVVIPIKRQPTIVKKVIKIHHHKIFKKHCDVVFHLSKDRV